MLQVGYTEYYRFRHFITFSYSKFNDKILTVQITAKFVVILTTRKTTISMKYIENQFVSFCLDNLMRDSCLFFRHSYRVAQKKLHTSICLMLNSYIFVKS